MYKKKTMCNESIHEEKTKHEKCVFRGQTWESWNAMIPPEYLTEAIDFGFGWWRKQVWSFMHHKRHPIQA